MLVATEILIDDYSKGSVESYNTSSILTGSLIRAYSDSSGSNYLSPMEYNYIRQYDVNSVSRAARYLTSIAYNDNIDYVFSADWPAFDQATRRIFLNVFDKTQNQWIKSGFLSISSSFTPIAQARALGAVTPYLYRYSSGSVEVNGIGVTGSSTNWSDNRMFQGSRIGFGTTSSAEVTQWYEIDNVPTNTNLQLAPTALSSSNYAAGTPYVIEELKLVVAHLQATGSFSGLLVAHGLHEGLFTATTNITSVPQYRSSANDRQRGFYLMRGPTTASIPDIVRNFATAIDPFPKSSNTHYAYVSLHAQTVGQMISGYQVYDILRPVSASVFNNGVITSSFVYATQSGSAGAASSIGSIGYTMQIVKTGHGPGSGSYNLYHNTSPETSFLGRIFRIPLNASTMYSGSPIYQESMNEQPPGGLQQTRAINGMFIMTYVPSIDKFVYSSKTSAGLGRLGMIQYQPGMSVNNRYGAYTLGNYNYITNTISDGGLPKHFITSGDPTLGVTCTNDVLYVAAGAESAQQNINGHVLFAVPIACDWETAPTTKQWVTFPPIDTTTADSYSTVYTKSPSFIGSIDLGFPPERFVIYYRTTGISDDSGKWTQVPLNGDLSKITVADQIQFSVAFDVLGTIGLYNRLQGLCFTFNDNRQDDHYQASLTESNIANNQVTWIQIKKWNSIIPNLKINIYNTATGTLLIDDTTAAQTQGIFEYSADNGATWNPWNATQDTIGNRIRYTATSLPANTNVKIILNRK